MCLHVCVCVGACFWLTRLDVSCRAWRPTPARDGWRSAILQPSCQPVRVERVPDLSNPMEYFRLSSNLRKHMQPKPLNKKQCGDVHAVAFVLGGKPVQMPDIFVQLALVFIVAPQTLESHQVRRSVRECSRYNGLGSCRGSRLQGQYSTRIPVASKPSHKLVAQE